MQFMNVSSPLRRACPAVACDNGAGRCLVAVGMALSGKWLHCKWLHCNWLHCAGAAVLTVACGGCQPSPSKYEVVGNVTLDGKPLSHGDILFSAMNNSASEAAVIKDGHYRIKVAAGRHKVVVNASERRRNPNPPGMRADEWYYPSIIPAQYNDQTILTADVAPPRAIDSIVLLSEPPSRRALAAANPLASRLLSGNRPSMRMPPWKAPAASVQET